MSSRATVRAVSDSVPDRVKKIEALYRETGLRRTQASTALLEELAHDSTPRTLRELHGSPRLETFDHATVYRQLIKMAQRGLVRELGLHQRARAYFLLMPGEHRDFLICRRCGSIESLNLRSCPAHELEQEVAERWGFRELFHELEFYGVCPGCHDAQDKRHQ